MKIKDIGTVVTGKTPATSHAEFYDGDYMFVTPTELHGGYKVSSSEKTITDEGIKSIKSNTIDGISVLVGCIGWDMGNVAMCFEKCATNQQINSITKIRDCFNPYYLYYWLSTKKDFLFSIASVTRTPILSKGVFEEIEIPNTDRLEQDKISKMLLLLDQKIEYNAAVNDNLQQMAHMTFMHCFWGKPTNGAIGEILIEHEKSPIQVGQAKNTVGSYPFFTSGDAVLRWKSSLIDGRNIFMNTGGNAGVKFYVGKAAYSTDTWCVSARDGLSDYLYLFLDSIKPELSQKFFQGTGLKHLQKPILKNRPMYIPTKDELEVFNHSVIPWLTLVSDNIRESERLAALRDWLLPMLMNGQATIED